MSNRKTVSFIFSFVLVLTLSLSGCGGSSGGSGNAAPVAKAGDNQSVSIGSVVTLDGSASTDAEGDTLTCSWSFTSVPSGSSAALSTVLSDTTLANPTFTPDTEGEYVVSLVVNDGTRDSDPDTVTITASTGVTAPVASITSPADGVDYTEGDSVTFIGTGSDTEDGTLTGSSLVWTSSLDGEIGSGLTVTTSTLTAGTHEVTLTVTDSHGQTGSASISVSINTDANNAPVPYITSPSDGVDYDEGDWVTFTGTGTDDEDGTLTNTSLVWTSSIDGEIGSGTSVSTSTLTDGAHTITLTVTDSGGLTGTASISVTITNNAPVAAITSPADGSSYDEGDSVTFDGTGTDDEDGSLSGSSLVWTSSIDGEIGTGTSLGTSGLSEGIHEVTLTATDSGALTASVSITVTIVGPWITQTGTSSVERVYGIALDSIGNIYITGWTDGDLGGTGNAGFSDIFIAKYDSTGTEQWITQTGTSGYEEAEGIAIDSIGNVFVTGHTTGDLGGTGNAGRSDLFLAKYDSTGTEQWITQTGTFDYDWSYGIAIDSSDNVYVTGYTWGDLGGTGNAGWSDIFIAKYDSTGTQQWITQTGTSNYDYSEGIAIDSSDNVYVTGRTTGDLAGTGNAGENDIFIAKYDSTGAEQWITQTGTSSSDFPLGIALDSSGNIYVTGLTAGDLGGTNAGANDIFTAKYDSTGTEQWITQIGTTSSEGAYGIAIDSSDNVYITGYTSGDLGDTNAGSADIFTAKYDSAGTEQWITQTGTTGYDNGVDIAIDSSDNVYVTGDTEGDLGGTNAGQADYILIKN